MRAVIDTNVLLVANQQHADVSPDCIAECVRRLQSMQQRGVTVIDNEYRILREYLNKTHPNQPKGPGDVFLKWLLRNADNGQHVDQVAITEITKEMFAEFPSRSLQGKFDAPDRKFAAVANAHHLKPPVWQAADCKWLDWWPELQKNGVQVEFVCPDDACRFYQKKFPKKKLPKLPKSI